MLLARATDGLGPLIPLTFHRGLPAWFELFEARLMAQSGPASGLLTLDDGTTASLTGSYNSGSYQLSGNGYSVSASASDGSLSGTVTGPRGTGTVSPMSGLAPATPPPADPTGVYSGTYQFTANGYFTNQTIATGVFDRKCGFAVVVSGTLTLSVLKDQGPGGRVVKLGDQWREAQRVVAPCRNHTDFSEQVIMPKGEFGMLYFGDVTKLVFAGVDQGEHDGGFGVRTFAFVGGLGGTTVEGRFARTSRFTALLLNGTNEHAEGFARTETSVTLIKR
jgi:hypothetical protein